MKGEKGGVWSTRRKCFAFWAEKAWRRRLPSTGSMLCHGQHACFFHVATIGSQRLPFAKSKLGIVTESNCSGSQLMHSLLPCRSGILSANHSFTDPSNLFRDCQRFDVSLGQPDPKLSINRYSDTGDKVYPRVELNRRSSEGKCCFSSTRQSSFMPTSSAGKYALLRFCRVNF